MKLLLNLLLLAIVALPGRGGRRRVTVEAPAVFSSATARGERARLSEHETKACSPARTASPFDAHSIQPYYANRCAAAGMTVSVETRDKEVELRAV